MSILLITYKNMIKKYILITILLLIPSTLKAETHVYSSDVKEDWVWNSEGSPYILNEPIYVPSGYSLKILEGVSIVSTTTEEDPYSLTIEGDFEAIGTKDSPIKFTNLYSIYLVNNSSYISNAIFEGTGIDFHNSTSSVEMVEINNAFNAITARASNIAIASTTLFHNTYAISSYIFNPMHMMYKDLDVGGLGNALDTTYGISDENQNIISIHNSRILESINTGILNQTLNVIDARNNWWGSKDGPNQNETVGLVDTEPWKINDPAIDIVCCSSIVFIPGLEASRLYRDEKGILGTSTNTLWEPNISKDIEKLYMNSEGVSIDKTIYTKDIIETIPFVKKIYSSFVDKMNGLVNDGYITRWISIPYDWRMDVRDVATDEVVNRIIDLASDSKTGKVSIVAHSNGGLLTKVIANKLEKMNRSDVLDQIIFVAVPELGTPQALMSMLHGYNQSIALGAIMDQNGARKLSQNMPGVYGLLPNERYFNLNPIKIINDTFKTNTSISTLSGMKDFLLNNSFSKLLSNNINVPLTLNSKLLSRTNNLHSDIDNWKPASTTKTTSIFGWGLPTGSGITYEKEQHCTKSCGVSFVPILDISGDGTVLTNSNSLNLSSSKFFNIKDVKRDRRGNVNHANILESQDLISKIADTLTNSSGDKPYDKYFSDTEPVDDDKYLTIKIYSPVDIDVYDAEGNHTGLIENSPYGLSESDIPGSFYGDFGNMKMIMVPYDTNSNIILNGNDTGTFVIKSEVTQNGNVLASTTFSELPVIPSTNIEFVLGSIDSFASSTSLNIDSDGDGTVDVIGRTDTYLKSTSTELIKDISGYIESIRKMIISLKLKKSEEKRYLDRLDNITRLMEKRGIKKTEKAIKKLINKRLKDSRMGDIQTKRAIKAIDGLIGHVEDLN